jgi:hypothetical protein|tara:strand:+ start:750 stop:1145 length:396 start_codon:yes stop_codon:yes gene_type:complete
MREKTKNKLKAIGGNNLQIKESYKSIEKKKKETFVSVITQFKQVWKISNELGENYGVNLVGYEDKYYRIIENLIFEHYGKWAGEIIMWWIYEVDNPKNELHHVYDKDNKKKHPVRTVTQLYTTLKKMKILK